MTASDAYLLTVAPFCVAGYQVRPSLLEVELGGEVRTLEPKVMGVLCHLAERPGKTVSRRELLDRGWSGTVVGDEVLTRCVSELRKAFGDDARAPTVVGTVPRIGYRLLAPVEWEPDRAELGGAESDAKPEPSPARDTAPGAPQREALKPLWWAAGVSALALFVAGYAWTVRSPDAGSAASEVFARPLTATPGYEMEPALAPDGQRVAYVGGERGPSGLFVLPTDGGEALKLVQGRDALTSPRWTPDGTRIAYIDHDRSAETLPDEACLIMEVSALGGPERVVGPCPGGAARTLDWTPDGQALIVGGDEAGAPTLSRVERASGAARALAYERPGGAIDDTPRVSADGRRVLFLRTVGGSATTVRVLDLEAERVTALASSARGVVGLDWLPDGGVVYAVTQAFRGELWRLAAADGASAPERLRVLDPGLRPDVAAGRLVFERWRVDGGLATFHPERPGELTPFAPSTAFDAHAQISPDGQRVAFLSERSGSLQVWVSGRDGSRPRAVTDLPGIALSPPRWSPDGLRLAFTALDADGADVFVLDHVGGALEQPRRLAVAGNEVRPAWSADGRWLYVASDRSGDLQIWRVPVGGGGGVQLTADGGVVVQPSPDGRTLYTMKPSAPGVWVRTGDGGEDTRLLADLAPRYFHLHRWAPADDGLVYVDRPAGAQYETLRSTTSAEPLFRFPESRAVHTLSWSPDDGPAIAGLIDRREVDLALADLAGSERTR